MTGISCRRWLSLLFALILLLSLAVPAFGEEGGETEPAEESVEPLTDPTETVEPQEELPGEAEAGGGISRVEGELSQDEPEAGEYTEIYVNYLGHDYLGDGSQTLPFASLARAAQAAQEAPTALVYILVTSDLELDTVARFSGKTVILQGQGGPWTLSRSRNFQIAVDALRGEYHPAMIELGSADGSRASAALMVENLILDDRGLSRGEKREAQQPLTPTEAPAEETAEETLTEEPAAEEVPAEEAPAGEVPEETAAEPEETAAPVLNNLDKSQDAIIAAYGDSSLILSAGAELRNFGGMSAVRLTGRSRLAAQEGSVIADVEEPAPEGEAQLQAVPDPVTRAPLSAVRLEDEAAAQVFEGAVLQEREGAAPSLTNRVSQPAVTDDLGDILNPGTQESSGDGSTLVFTADPDEIHSYQTLYKTIAYSLDFTLSEDARSTLEAASKVEYLSDVDFKGTITVTLDERLTQELSEPGFSSDLFELDGEPVHNEDGTFRFAFKLRENWKDNIGKENQKATLSFSAQLPLANFAPSTAEKDEIIKTTARVDLEIKVSETGSPANFSLGEKTAETKMLSAVQLSAVIYDVNGGNDGTGPRQDIGLSEQQNYKLKQTPAPTHAPEEDGTPILFLGWSTEKDEHIYVNGDESKPQTTETVAVPGIDPANLSFTPSVTVYAVWGYDENGDGIADVDQVFATLTFNANGGVGAPEPIVHVVGTSDSSASGMGFQVDIPEQEPSRDYYTFDGWSEDPDATAGEYRHDADKAAKRDIRVSEDTTLYAVWVKNYTLYYDANGGSNAPGAQTLLTQTKNDSGKYSGKLTITDQQPTRSGYTFKGWAVTRRGSAQFLAGDEAEITGGDVTLYAVWERTGGSSSSGSSGSSAAKGPGANPKTGDESNPVFFAVLALVALAAVVAVVIFLLRRNRRDGK